MKKLLAAAAIAAAFVVPAEAGESGYKELCQTIATSAEKIMEGRQNGVPMGTFLTIVEKTDKVISEAARQLVILAYNQPHYSTPEVQQKTIGDFRDQVHVTCLSTLK